VVDAVVGGGVTDGARVLSHTLSFWLTAILLSVMLAATAYGTRAHTKLQSSRIGVYGPLCLMAVATLLVIADPLRRVLQNGGVWTGPSSGAFREGCGEGWKCLTTTGIMFMAVSEAFALQPRDVHVHMHMAPRSQSKDAAWPLLEFDEVRCKMPRL
jgi:hypothetical protein